MLGIGRISGHAQVFYVIFGLRLRGVRFAALFYYFLKNLNIVLSNITLFLYIIVAFQMTSF